MAKRLTVSGATTQRDIDRLLEVSNCNQFGRNGAYYKLQHYEDLEEQGRLITLPEGMDLKKLIKCTDGDGPCPRDVGLADRCELSCLECWLAALKGAENATR